MPMPYGRGRLDAMSKAFRHGAASRADFDCLLEVIAACGEVASAVHTVLEAEFAPQFEVVSRMKSLPSIIEKLQRENGVQLKNMRDLGGVRLLCGSSRLTQDRVTARIIEIFPAGRTIDRRDAPSAGYRAVHVEVTRDGIPVEIQIRTTLQHLWAESFERFADLIGRQIRYGLPPDDPTAIALSSLPNPPTVGEFLDLLLQASRTIADFEEVDLVLRERQNAGQRKDVEERRNQVYARAERMLRDVLDMIEQEQAVGGR